MFVVGRTTRWVPVLYLRDTHFFDQFWARNSLGVHPATRLNIRLKCWGYWNPRS